MYYTSMLCIILSPYKKVIYQFQSTNNGQINVSRILKCNIFQNGQLRMFDFFQLLLFLTSLVFSVYLLKTE